MTYLDGFGFFFKHGLFIVMLFIISLALLQWSSLWVMYTVHNPSGGWTHSV